MRSFNTDRICGIILSNGWTRVEFKNEGWQYDIPTKIIFDFLEGKIHEDVVVQCGEYVAWDNGEHTTTREELLEGTLKMYEEGEFSTFEAVTTEFKSRDEIYKSLAGTKEGRITAGHKSFYFIEDDYFTFRAFVVGAWEMGEKMEIRYKK